MHRLLTLLILALISPHTLAASPKDAPLSVVYTNSDPVFKNFIEHFQKSNTLALDVAWVDQSELAARLLAAKDDEHVPDVLITAADLLGQHYEINASEIPRPLFEHYFKEQPDIFNALRSENEKLYGLPLTRGNHLVLYYNKKLIRQPATNWRELLAHRGFLSADTRLLGWNVLDMYWFIPFIASYGPLPTDASSIYFHPDTTTLALEFVWSLVNLGVLDIYCDYNCNLASFSQGKMAYHINGVWEIDNFETALGDNLGIAPLPDREGQALRSYYSTTALMFPRLSLDGARKKDILAFIEFAYSTDAQKILSQSRANFPFHHKNDKHNPNMALLVQALDNAIPMPSKENMHLMWEGMLKGFVRFGGGAMDAREASDLMNQYLIQSTGTSSD